MGKMTKKANPIIKGSAKPLSEMFALDNVSLNNGAEKNREYRPIKAIIKLTGLILIVVAPCRWAKPGGTKPSQRYIKINSGTTDRHIDPRATVLDRQSMLQTSQ